jgi:RNA polymerase sigma factor (sigma-70 family)
MTLVRADLAFPEHGKRDRHYTRVRDRFCQSLALVSIPANNCNCTGGLPMALNAPVRACEAPSGSRNMAIRRLFLERTGGAPAFLKQMPSNIRSPRHTGKQGVTLHANPAVDSVHDLMADHATPTSAGQTCRVFATTRWTVVLQAGGPTSEASAQALEHLCRTYWYPLYSYARRCGVSPHDAEDLTQSFFAHLLEKGVVARADRERGRFRTFLLTTFRHYQINAHAKTVTVKRGGGQAMVSFEELQAEQRYVHDASGELSPEKLFDQRWATSLLERVMLSLRAEYATLGKGALFDLLHSVVWGGRSETGYAALAQEAGLSEGAFRVAVHRLRTRLKECLRHEVAQTVATPGEIDDELRHLMASLRV